MITLSPGRLDYNSRVGKHTRSQSRRGEESHGSFLNIAKAKLKKFFTRFMPFR